MFVVCENLNVLVPPHVAAQVLEKQLPALSQTVSKTHLVVERHGIEQGFLRVGLHFGTGL